MKICHLCTGYPLSFQGGITNYVRALAESQQKAGHEVWAISGDPKQTYSYQVLPYESAAITPMTFRALEDKAGLNSLKEFFQAHNFDLIHIHMILDVDWDLAEVLKPYRYVVSLHDYFYLCPRVVMLKPGNPHCTQYSEDRCRNCVSWFNTQYIPNGIERRIKKLGWKNFHFPFIPQNLTAKRFAKFKKLLENAKLLLPVSTRVREIYENSGIQNKYQVMHIGNLTADNYKPEFTVNAEKAKIDVVMLGTLMELKGADLFVMLAQKLDPEKFNFHFYGRSASYAEAIKQAGITDHGPYKQAELSQILASSDLGLVLSIWEDNGPQVVMEMLNNHVPVVGTRMGGIPDFVNEKNGFLFDPYCQEDIDRLVHILNNLTMDDIITLKRNIRPTMTTYAHADQMEAVYQDLMDENS